jgi:hypothetical protein
MNGCRFSSVSNGTGPVWDIYNVAGNVYNRGAAGFDPEKVSGTVIYLPTDTTNWKGAAAPALTGDPYAQINTKIPKALPQDDDGKVAATVAAGDGVDAAELLTATGVKA